MATEVPLSATTHPNKVGSSTAATVQPDVIGSDVVATIQPDVPRPSAAAVAQPRATAHGNVPTVVETRGIEGASKTAIDEETPNEKSSPAAAVPPSWEEMMEILKGCHVSRMRRLIPQGCLISSAHQAGLHEHGW